MNFQTTSGPPSNPPPSLPSYAQPPPASVYPALPATFGGPSSLHDDPWADPPKPQQAPSAPPPFHPPPALPTPASVPAVPQQNAPATPSSNQFHDDDFDDDWSDEDEEVPVSFDTALNPLINSYELRLFFKKS